MKTLKAAAVFTGLITALALPAAAQAGHRDGYHDEFRRQAVSGHSYYTGSRHYDRHDKHHGRHDKHYKHHRKAHGHHHDYVYYERRPAYYERHVHTRYCDHRQRGFDTRVKVFLGF